jgi:hypothetical protein
VNDEVTKYLGELAAAAKFDLDNADPSHVAMDGTSVIAWRRAYLEGVKDAIEGIITRQPELQDAVREHLARRSLELKAARGAAA